EETEEEHHPHRRTPALLATPTVALMAAAVAMGVVPGLSRAAQRAAAAFEDRRGYVAAVLGGVHGRVANAPASGVEGTAVIAGVLSGLAAVALALGALYRSRVATG